MEITSPLRLSTGSHQAGSGKGCVMNVISWENGDQSITDYPECSARPLARLMQMYNDTICTHTNDSFLCAPCAVRVLDLGHQTVGTADQPREKVNEWLQACLALIPKGRHDAAAAAYAAYAATADAADAAYATYATAAATADAYVAYAASDAASAYAAAAYDAAAAAYDAATADAYVAYAASEAASAYASAYAAAAAYAATADATAAAIAAKLEFIEKAVALWHSVCGTTPVPINTESLNTALKAMAEVH